jgi:hypothetical protein
MNNDYQLVIRPKGSRGRILWHTYDEDERLDVEDLETRAAMRVPAREISPYRHTLLLRDGAYQILTIMKKEKSNSHERGHFESSWRLGLAD